MSFIRFLEFPCTHCLRNYYSFPFLKITFSVLIFIHLLKSSKIFMYNIYSVKTKNHSDANKHGSKNDREVIIGRASPADTFAVLMEEAVALVVAPAKFLLSFGSFLTSPTCPDCTFDIPSLVQLPEVWSTGNRHNHDEKHVLLKRVGSRTGWTGDTVPEPNGPCRSMLNRRRSRRSRKLQHLIRNKFWVIGKKKDLTGTDKQQNSNCSEHSKKKRISIGWE